MTTDDRTYVIEPDATDPDLLRSLTPLGDDPGRQAPRPVRHRSRRSATESPAAAVAPPPARPVLWLTGAYALGPFGILMTGRGRRHWARWTAAMVALVAAAAAAWMRTMDAARLGGGDQAIQIQALALAAAAVIWLAVWCTGLVLAARRCREGPLSRRGERRPLAAGLAGLAAPGLGLLLAGRPWRSVIAVLLTGAGAAAGLALTRAADWWAWHRAQPAALGDLQLEQALLVMIAVTVAGALAWLVSALEGGRLAAGPRVVRAVASADRVPAAFLVALLALGIWFQPADTARELDLLTGRLVDRGLRLVPLWTARAAARLVPADPVLEWRVAERQSALGRTEAAAATRERLIRRWQRLAAFEDLAARSGAADAAATMSDPPAASLAPAPPADMPPISAPLASARSSPPPPPAR